MENWKYNKNGRTMDGDPIVLFKWNLEGLQARVHIAAQQGLTNFRNTPVATATDMIEAIAKIITSSHAGGVALSRRHDMFQFLPAVYRDIKMNQLMVGRQYLRHCGHGWTFPSEEDRLAALQWPDIVESLQVIMITNANALVGPVDIKFYFND